MAVKKDQPSATAEAKLDVTLGFIRSKETPGTYVYSQVDADGNPERTPVGTLYIKKDAMTKGVPDILRVHIIGE
jgi:hypothetical protein